MCGGKNEGMGDVVSNATVDYAYGCVDRERAGMKCLLALS